MNSSGGSGRLLVAPLDFQWWRPESAMWANRDEISAYLPRWGIEVDDEGRIEGQYQAQKLDYANPWLVAGLTSPYEPLREFPALFRKFAALPLDRDAYLAFAKRYGPLTRRRPDRLPERLSDWAREHLSIRCAVRLYEALESGATDDLEALGITVRTESADAEAPLKERLCATVAPTEDDQVEALFECLADERDIEDAERVCSSICSGSGHVYIEPDMSSRTVVQLVLSALLTVRLEDHLATVTIGPSGSPLGLGLQSSLKVDNLVGALWVQLGLAALGNRTYRSCPVCGEWWDATNSRTHKTVCSDNCRAKRSYRERKAAKEEAAETDESS